LQAAVLTIDWRGRNRGERSIAAEAEGWNCGDRILVSQMFDDVDEAEMILIPQRSRRGTWNAVVNVFVIAGHIAAGLRYKSTHRS